MKQLIWISIILAATAGFFASGFPDGLDFVSRKLGLAYMVIERSCLMSGYSISFFPQNHVNTAITGILGVLLTMSIFYFAANIFKFLKRD